MVYNWEHFESICKTIFDSAYSVHYITEHLHEYTSSLAEK